MTRQGVAAERKQSGGNNMLRGFGLTMASGVASDYLNLRNQGMLSKNGFDVLGNDNSMVARLAGGLLGGLLGTLIEPGGGTMIGAGIGSQLVGTWADGITEQQKKQSVERQEFFKNLNRYRSVTGDRRDYLPLSARDGDLENIGVNYKQYLQNRTQWAVRRGNNRASDQTTLDSFYLERGYGVDQTSSASIIEMMRSSKNVNSSLEKFVGGVLQKGKNSYFKDGDTSFLNEFLSKFTSLQKQLLNNQTTVATGTTMDILSRFNKVGGAFATSDPRSGGLVSGINSAISNPQGDFARAMMMYSIRRDHPDIKNPLELMIQMQKGLAGGNLQSVYKTYNRGNGSEWSKIMGFSGFSELGGQLAFGQDLWSGLRKGVFKGKLSNTELSAAIPGLKERAEENTAPIERDEAHITNAWQTEEAADKIADAIKDAVMKSMEGWNVDIKDGKIVFKSQHAVKKENVVRTAQQQEEQGKINSMIGDTYNRGLNMGY